MENYNNFINHREFSNYSLEELEIMEMIMISEVYKLDESLKNEIISDWESLNEGIINNIKDKANEYRRKLFKMGDKLGDEAKGAWDSIKTNVKAAVNMIRTVIESITSGLSKIKKYCNDKIVNGLKKSESFTKKTKEMAWTHLDVEVKNLQKFTIWVEKKLYSFLMSGMKETMIGLFTKKDKNIKITESFLFESEGDKKPSKPLDLFRKMIGFIEKQIPFSWLHKIAESAGKDIQSLIDILNKITKKFGGPELAIPSIVVLLGIAVEYGVKSLTKAQIINIVPGVGTILYGISYVAIFVSCIHAIDAILDGKILGGHH